MMKRAVVISGGDLEREFCLAFLAQTSFAYKIGADRGLAFMNENGIVPTHIVGDFDSADRGLLKAYETDPHIEISLFRPEKDFTDTQIAVEKALALGAGEIWILGGTTGTRVDHLLANVRTLTIAARQGVPCYLVDAHNKLYVVKEGLRIARDEQYGKFVSLFAADEAVEGVTLTGFKYPLKEYLMTAFDPIGVSNEIVCDMGEIAFKSGLLLVVECTD